MSIAGLTPFDWFLLAIVALSTLFAFSRGIIKVLFSLGGLVLGILVASWNYGVLAARLTLISSPEAAQVAAFLLLLVGVMVVFTLVAGLLRKAVSAVGLGLFDRLMGALFGFARGVLLGVAVMFAVTAFVPDWAALKNSQLAPYFLDGAHAVSFIVPVQLQQQVTVGATHLLQRSPELLRPRTLTQPDR